MAHHAEDISKIEDIGERLDALLDALEASSEEVARASASLDEPPPPPPVAADDGKAEPQAEAEPQTAGVDSSAEPPAERTSRPEPEPEPEAEPEAEAEADAQRDSSEPADEASQTDAEADAEPDEEPEPEVYDGLLIEPESQEPESQAHAVPDDDIDGVPAGATDLAAAMDDELAALLATGAFEDPAGEMGLDESADQVELPEDEVEEDADARAEAELLASTAEPEGRTPKPPTDEAELIGELDEQLAALADAQLAGDATATPEPEPDPPPAATKPEPVDTPPETAAEEATPSPASADDSAEAAPRVETGPTASPDAEPWWRSGARRVIVVGKPVVVRAAGQAGRGLVTAARRASAPLDGRPQLKQIVGWIALVQAFLAACVWVYLALWHEPPQPPAAPQPTLERPVDG